jgi:hypothetical protein
MPQLDPAQIDLETLLAELDRGAACDRTTHADACMDRAAGALRALRADFERAARMAHTYGKTASVDHVRFTDVAWLDAARARWSIKQ